MVEIQRGGMGLIRVTDNGCGIAPEELPVGILTAVIGGPVFIWLLKKNDRTRM